MTIEPCDVTCDETIVVVVDGLPSFSVAAGVVEATADDSAAEVTDSEAPVDRLTCLFSSLAKASSIWCAGTADADIRAKRKNDQGCILQIRVRSMCVPNKC